MGKRQEAAAKTRQSIIDAVAALGAEKGFNQVSIEDITTRAGVAKGTFYVYFKRKEDVISELAYGSFEGIKRETRALAGVQRQVAHYLTASTEVIVADGMEIAQQWLRCAVAPMEGERHGVEKLAYDVEFITACLADAVQSGELKPAAAQELQALAQQITAQYYGCLALWCITGGKTSMNTLMESYCQTQLPLILAAYTA